MTHPGKCFLASLFKSIIFLTLAIFLINPGLHAQEIAPPTGEMIIKDAAGFTRAVAQGDGSVTFELIDTVSGSLANGVEVTLTNVATGETLTATAVNGSAAFSKVAAGEWVVAGQGVTFTSISVAPVAAAGIAGLGAAGTGVAAVGAAGAATAVGIEAGNDDSSPVSPSE